ncbi:S-adenosyl-L-methionine-dependent methyltransferase [Dactylonectria macrodidyma]|uniref:tRNA wybutosine-synthesizing protein 2 n=1 Tax=Dactylonectria macrodidyma TaxID=307937 RepID=A0A9P9F5S5_9HYPO|nr:S-adenosyl-L-methionine-dependent methyltransferase [Dactylonectria macrodidyma]
MPKPKTPKANPIQTAIRTWLTSVPQPDGNENQKIWQGDLLNSAPKRFTIYEPMALLPSGSFTNEAWTSALRGVGQDSSAHLWSLILKELSIQAKGNLTHLATNEGIPLHKDGAVDENVLRSPSGLRILYGNFGSTGVTTETLSQNDFDEALWVSTKQNGIFQTWAPKWTMFSRGNIKEKARLLDMKSPERGSGLFEQPWAMDLYAGIGYFVFSYARLGFRVLCWEINPWSVEGLRRGAIANRWTVRVVQGNELELPVEEIIAGGDQIIVFLESNEEALGRIQSLQAQAMVREIRHINCGFLPTSEPTWRHTWEMSSPSTETWLHLHENVGVNDTEARQQEIQHRFEGWMEDKEKRTVKVEHIELVKTFAPGVWHCVFDVHVQSSSSQ